MNSSGKFIIIQNEEAPFGAIGINVSQIEVWKGSQIDGIVEITMNSGRIITLQGELAGEFFKGIGV